MTQEQEIRVRYAPSPTGEPHVGNIRTALFNWLFARHAGGKFILRIEDTDQMREAAGATEAIIESLRWLGLQWDEGPEVGGPYGPYIQSQRLPLYQEAAQHLIDVGNAYTCYCTPEELEAMRKAQQQRREPPRYDRRCRDPQYRERLAKEGRTGVVRFKTPLEGEPIVVHDLVREDVSFDPATLDDFVLLKSDGFPTYHLANVVDDHFMGISHVMRAEEWLPSTPRHLLLYHALGYEPPKFAHLPMILGPDRSKLSKRHGATATLDYRDLGFLPEAMVNFLALLGWSLDDKTDIISREELVRHFSLERVSKSPAIFNMEKLTWMNGVYIRQMPGEELAARLAEVLEEHVAKKGIAVEPLPTAEALLLIVPLVQERVHLLAAESQNPKTPGVWDLCGLFLVGLPEYGDPPFKNVKLPGEEKARALEEAIAVLEGLEDFSHAALEGVLRPLVERLGLRTREAFMLIRVAVTGTEVSPPLFETMAVLGKERVLRRLRYAAGLVEN
ncbi:MAG: glutamate--tRNA ligase [Chloroflexi bacterium]|nr:glutamate--tRNA ligase [Chloroflexota bacterium]